MIPRLTQLIAAIGLCSALGACSSGDPGPSRDVTLADLDLDAYSRVSYPVGTVFSFSLTTVDTSVSGRLTDLHASLSGSGLRVLGFQVTNELSPGFDVRRGFPPTARWLRALTDAEGAEVPAGQEGMRLMVGLEVVSGEYSQVEGLEYTVVDDEGEAHHHVSPVGLGQCYDTTDEIACPSGWVSPQSGPPR